MVLDGLELASRFTWDLTELDLFGNEPTFKKGPGSPYGFVLCGTDSYGGIRQLLREPGTDGTVRWAGCALNAQRISVDFSRDPAADKALVRVKATNNDSTDILPMPVWLLPGMNHATIISNPTPELQDLVLDALKVRDDRGFAEWNAKC